MSRFYFASIFYCNLPFSHFCSLSTHVPYVLVHRAFLSAQRIYEIFEEGKHGWGKMLALLCNVSPSSLNTSTECEQQWMAAGTGALCETQPMFAPKHCYLQHSPVPVLLQLCIIHEKPLGDAGDAVTASGPRSRQTAQSSNKWLVWKHLTLPRVRTPECWWYTEESCIETERETSVLCTGQYKSTTY